MAGCADHAAYIPECRAFRGLLQWHATNLMGCSWQSRPAGCCEGRGVLPAGKGRGHGERPPSSTGGGAIGVEWVLERDYPPLWPAPPPKTECAAAHFPLRVTTHDCASLRIVRVAILGMLRATAHVCTPQKARKRACARKSTQAGNPDGGGVKIHCCVAHLCKTTSRRHQDENVYIMEPRQNAEIQVEI